MGMETNDLKSIIQAEVDDAIGYIESETVEQRKQALEAYLRQPYGNEVEGKSQIVTGEVAEAIDGALPSLVRIFTGSDNIVVFEPQGPRDEASAKQATDYCNWVFNRDNAGVAILHDWFKDALMQKNGIVKAYWENKEDITKERYFDLSDDELAMLMSDETMEIVEQDTTEFPIIGPMGQPVIDPMGMPVMASTHNVVVQQKKKSGKVTIENVPPEEFLISKKARTIADSPFVAHRQMLTRSDLVAMGFNKKQVESLQMGDALAYTPERVARYAAGEQPYQTQTDDPSMQEIEVFECYVKTDMNGKGIAALTQVFYASNEILQDEDGKEMVEEVDYVPFHSICPIPIPHKFFGNSLADRTVDLQLIKTTITRQMLDNLYLTNNARVVAVEGQVNLDDLLTSTAGGVIRAKSQGAVQQLVVQNVANQAFPMLQYLDTVQSKRTGVSDASQGLDPAILQNVTAAAVASMQQAGAGKIELIARIFAETGVKSLFQGILHLLCKYQDKARMVRMRGEFVEFDPRTWANQYDVSINVGLGAGNRQEQMAMLSMVLAKQEQLIGQYGPANPYVSPAQYRGTLGRMVEIAGFKDSAEFYKAITPEQDQALSNPPPQQQQMPPEVQALMARTQAEIQANQAKAQADLQMQQQQMQIDMEMAQQKAALEMQLMREKEMAKLQLEREKQQAYFALKQQEFEAEAQLKAMKIGAGITSNVEIRG
jgi:GrpB-like predicted nucleotidyltransferase (UPF0157 family)